ncbi:hypothetical protein M501DRAFT_944258 [Patellaria atrata CBS 101060]|uniref:Uncharacterized protein n=1 Tax=Patellaria atrata CBS 101060 TaxID=1346257 RepID=A0A9P4S0Z9_9PEZI|nr:hypothetical protein M501DRAFT_944258 [Patellaria atrata CBS 101060]
MQQGLIFLRRQFFQLVDLHALRWPESVTLKSPISQEWIFKNMFDLDNIQYPPPERYRLRVLKELIRKIESSIDDPEEDEISDDLMSSLSELLSSKLLSEADAAQQKSYVTYSLLTSESEPSSDRTVTLLESRSVISSTGTTGLRTWEAALHLGAFLSSNDGKNYVSGKNILELGAGTGFVSILCAKHLGAKHVTATDGDEGIVDSLNTNIFLNDQDADRRVEAGVLRWGWSISEFSYGETITDEPYGLIIGADVTYDKSVIPSLVSTLRELLALCPTADVLIAATIRNEKTFQSFLAACARHKLEANMIEYVQVPETQQRGLFYPTGTPIKILHITQSPGRHDPSRY